MEPIIISDLPALRAAIVEILQQEKTGESYRDKVFHFIGEFSQDIARTYGAMGTYRRARALGGGGALVGGLGVLAGSALAVPTAGLSLMVTSAIGFFAAAKGFTASHESYATQPYANEVYILEKRGFKVARNDKELVIVAKRL